MKKLFTLVAAIAVTAFAASAYSSLNFYTTEGGDTHATVVVAEGLVVTIDGDNLIVQPKEGGARSIALNTLVGMEFSDNETSDDETTKIESLFSETGILSVYSLDGLFKGDFASLEEAAAALPVGLYVIETHDGKSFKILLGK